MKADLVIRNARVVTHTGETFGGRRDPGRADRRRRHRRCPPGRHARDRRRRPRADAGRDRPALPPRRQLPLRRGHAHRDGSRRAGRNHNHPPLHPHEGAVVHPVLRRAPGRRRGERAHRLRVPLRDPARGAHPRDRDDRRRDRRQVVQALLRLRGREPDRHRPGHRRLGLRDDAEGCTDPRRRRLRPLREHRDRDVAEGGADRHRAPGSRRVHRVATRLLRGRDDPPDDLPRRADRLPALRRPHDRRAGAGRRRGRTRTRRRRHDRDLPALPDPHLLRPRSRHAREDLAAAARSRRARGPLARHLRRHGAKPRLRPRPVLPQEGRGSVGREAGHRLVPVGAAAASERGRAQPRACRSRGSSR